MAMQKSYSSSQSPKNYGYTALRLQQTVAITATEVVSNADSSYRILKFNIWKLI